MCTSKTWIYNSHGQKLFVNCGKCPSCLQSKAIQRTNKIRATHVSGQTALFVTLTYNNQSIPYIVKEELDAAPIQKAFQDYNSSVKTGDFFKEINIYRNCEVKKVRCGSSQKDVKYKRIYKKDAIVTDLSIPYVEGCKFKRLTHSSRKEYRIGVVYYKDVQDFFKRLRQNLKRKYKYDSKFQYFSVAEYGPTTCRPHFHLLIFCPSECVETFKAAIVASWPFDDGRRTRDYIKIAIDASAYVSSYVNSDSSVPSLFRVSKQVKPRHSASKTIGFGVSDFSLPEVVKKFRLRDLHYSKPVLKQGVLEDASFLLPEYVIRRYFPKIKGYCSLSADEIFRICINPKQLSFYGPRRLDYNEDDLHKNGVRLINKIVYASENGISPFEYASIYSQIWSVRSSNILMDAYKSIETINDNFYAYDNIKDYYTQLVLSPTLDVAMHHLPEGFSYIDDGNYFPDNIARTSRLESAYHSYSKDKKVRNEIYSKSHNM